MTTLTEISELKTEMDAKFDRVFDQIAELQTETNGLRHDMDEGFAAVNGRLDQMDGKLDKLTANVGLLLKAQGIDDTEAAA